MIIFTWVALAIFAILFLLWEKRNTQPIFFKFCIILAAFFLSWDAWLSINGMYIEKTHTITQEREYCDLTAVSSDCVKNVSVMFDNSTAAQEYLALHEAEKSAMELIFALTPAAILLAGFYLIWEFLKNTGWIRR